MNWSDIYLVCFAVGALWSVASLLLSGVHLGHSDVGHLAQGHTHADFGDGFARMINPSCAAIFLTWFGGVGYLLTRHSGVGFWIALASSIMLGVAGAWILGRFIRFLQAREQPLNPADYEIVGVLGRVSSPIRADGVGEVIYVRDGARRPIFARSEDGNPIGRGEEVIVTRYENGIAYVRTWEAMTQ